jgi:hypothetical protein
MYASPTAPAPNAAPRIGEWFSESFSLFGREWGTWLLQGLIFTVLSSIPIIPGMVMYYTAIFGAMMSGSGSSSPPDIGLLLPGLLGLYGGGCVSALLSLFLMCGMTRTAMKQVRGEPISVGDLFSGGDVFLPALGAYILALLGIELGLMFCLVPGLVLLGLWIFVHPLVVEGRRGVLDAFRISLETTKPYLWSYVGWGLLMMLVYFAGAMVGCGIIVALPLMMLMLMVSYRDVFEGRQPVAYGVPGMATPSTYYGPAGAPAVGGTCPSCGRVVAAGAVVCPACGNSLPGGSGLSSPPGE